MNPAPGAPNYPIASIYVDDLAADVTEAMLFEKFSIVGAVLSIRVCRDIETRCSLSHAYVNFQQPAAAERALDAMNFDPIRGRPCRIMSSQRDPSLRKSRVWNIFIKNLDESIDNKALYDTFSAFGNILSCKIAQAEDGTSNGYGFVHFDTEEAADNAIGKVNGMLLNGKEVYAKKWMSRRERQEKLGNQPKKFTNVYVKSFGEDMDEEHFKELADNIKVILGGSGRSKGFGFVSYETPEEAQKAAGQQVGQVFPQAGAFYMQPLAQRKDPPLTLSALAAASMQYQKQIIGERLYPLIQATHPKQVGKITGMLLELDNVELLHMLESPEALAAKIQEVVSVLRAHSAKEEKQIIGERLYPLIQATHPKQVGKITGMLLELDNVELLHMLESPEALAAKIQEAVSVLRAHSAKEEKQIIGERLYPLIQATHPKQVGKITGMLLELDNVELLHMLESPEALAAKIQEAVSVLRAYSAKKKSAEMKN